MTLFAVKVRGENNQNLWGPYNAEELAVALQIMSDDGKLYDTVKDEPITIFIYVLKKYLPNRPGQDILGSFNKDDGPPPRAAI